MKGGNVPLNPHPPSLCHFPPFFDPYRSLNHRKEPDPITTNRGQSIAHQVQRIPSPAFGAGRHFITARVGGGRGSDVDLFG